LPQDHVVSPLESRTPGFACTPRERNPMESNHGSDGPGYWFQHDDAPAHGINVVREYLDENFGNRLIGRGGPLTWPTKNILCRILLCLFFYEKHFSH
jgi:hypothetical protein